MSWLRILAGPLIGAVIGYITNYIAIKMLFRPLQPKYVLGIRLPFTPGIIPRRKAQLADALGKAVFARFFNWDDLEIVFLSGEFADEVSERIAIAFYESDASVGQMLERLPAESAKAAEDALVQRFQKRLVEDGTIRRMALNFGAKRAEDGQETGSSLARSLAGAYAGPIAEQAEAYLTEDDGAHLRELLQTEISALSAAALGDTVQTLFPDRDAFRQGFKELYLRFMRTHVRPIVESIDIVTQITGKMNQMTAGEVEVLVLDIVSRELRMVVWFGAFLGAVIGAVNIFI